MAGTHARVWGLGLVLLAVYLFSGCGGLPSDGASRSQVLDAPESDHLLGGIQLVTVDDAVTRKLMAGYKSDLFSEVFGPGRPQTYLIGPGDVL